MLSDLFQRNSFYAITAILLLSASVNCNEKKTGNKTNTISNTETNVETNTEASTVVNTVPNTEANTEVNTEVNSNSPQTLTVDVYYETLCPDSVRFIRYQLYEAMIEKKLLNYTNLNFIPYGKVKTWFDPFTHKKYLDCQHGQRECELNSLHACIVENNSILEQVQMIDCLMGRYTVKECVQMLSINVAAALQCRNSRSIENILQKYGDKTKTVDLWFVPSIGMDDTFEPQLQDRIRSNFAKVFCSKYKKKYNIKLDNC